MRIIFFHFCLFFSLAQIFGQSQPRPVQPLTRAVFDLAYYQEQAQLWETETRSSEQDAYAWLYYYTAARNSNSLAGQELYDLDAIIAGCEAAAPDSYEYFYLSFWQMDFANPDRWNYLLKAEALGPQRVEVLHDLMSYYELKGERTKRKEYGQRWLASQPVGIGVMEWNYNALASVTSNGVLLTLGDNDTYPAWALQDVQGIRQDVEVVNLYMLVLYPDYRAKICRGLGIPDDLDLAPTLPLADRVEQLIGHFIQHIPERVHLGIATPEGLRQTWASQLYLTGLAFKHAQGAFANLENIRKNWEDHFRKDALIQPLETGPIQKVSDEMNMNYLPSLILLHRLYEKEGSENKAEKTRALSQNLAKRVGKQEQIEAYFQAKPNSQFSSYLDLKQVEKNMMLLPSGIYASATEVTNELYNQYLLDLIDQKQTALLEQYVPQPVFWRSLLPVGLSSLPPSQLFDNGHPEDLQAPIVNISHAAALAFCDWLNTVYNQANYPKKRFQQVRFRLPTETEWVEAARGGHQMSPYPWGGYYFRNAKGCYLANANPFLNAQDSLDYDFRPGECTDSPGADGGFFPVVVDAYHPNDYGLYNVAGNAAEMVDDPSYSLGGSWLSSFFFAEIGRRQEQTLPNPGVGFRLFMEVLKE